MQIVIDIPDNYMDCIDDYEKGSLFDMALTNAIKNGIPLDKIRAEIEEQKKDRCFDDMFEYITGLDDALYIIDNTRQKGEDRK